MGRRRLGLLSESVVIYRSGWASPSVGVCGVLATSGVGAFGLGVGRTLGLTVPVGLGVATIGFT